MAGIDGAGITSAGVNGAGTNGLPSPSDPTSPPSPVAPPRAGPVSTLARRQYSALARMRWQMFQNGLRSTRGIFEVGARTLAYTIYAVGGLGISVGIGFGAWGMVSRGKPQFLPILFWAVFLIWQLLPVLLASFQEQFDLGILLRFPLRFSSYVLLYMVFGIIDVSTVTGGLCTLGLWVGIVIAKPGAAGIAAIVLLVFAAFNVLLVRSIFAWIDRWLAQRRTREIVGAIFLLFVLSLQLLNPALRQGRWPGTGSRSDRAAEQRRTFDQMRPWLERGYAVERWLPPGLAAQSVRRGVEAQLLPATDALVLLILYAVAAATTLALRLNAEYGGESLSDAPARKKASAKDKTEAATNKRDAALNASGAGSRPLTAARSATDPSSNSSGAASPISAIIAKEFHSMQRTLPMLYAIGAPLFLMIVLSGVFNRVGSSGRPFPFALPICIVYALLGFTQLFYNNFGAEGMGIQLYFLAPTPIRTVVLAKNLFHALLFCVVACVGGIAATLRTGAPDPAIIASSAAWLLFALPCNLAAGNFFSLAMAYRVNPGRITRQKGSQLNNLLAVLVQVGVMGIGALVFWSCWAFDKQWLAVIVFLVLAMLAALLWRFSLSSADSLANRNREKLVETLAKTA